LIYEYQCQECLHNFEVVKPVRDMERVEHCPACGVHETVRLFRPRIHIHGAKVEDAEFNPGLGQVIKNKNHRAEVARQKGLVEVGSETADTLHRETVVKREKQREREWSEL
jgi:putative FmdB family regulatory protein